MPPYATFSIPSSPDLFESNKVYSPATGSSYPHVLLLMSLPLALASPPFPGRAVIFSTTILALAMSTQIDAHFTNDPGTAQPFSQLWSVWLATLEKIFSSTRSPRVGAKPVLGPESLFWRKTSPAQEGEYMAGFGQAKLLWALGIVFNLRGANWNYQVRNVPELSSSEKRSRVHFVHSRAVKTLYCFLMADIANQLWMQLFFVGNTGSGYTNIGQVNSKYLTIKDPDWTWRFIKSVVWGPLPYYLISFQYNLISMVTVALTLFDPEDWPPLFGPISRVTTVRAFWGQFWHQLIRRSFNTFTGYAVDICRIPRGTTLSSQTQIWLAFLMSAFFHAQLNLITPVPSNIVFEERTTGIVLFFVWQAFAISLEDAAQGLWIIMCRNSDIQEGRKSRIIRTYVGWMWVFTSFWISIPWAGDLTLRFRFGDELMVPFSVVGPLVEQIFHILRNSY